MRFAHHKNHKRDTFNPRPGLRSLERLRREVQCALYLGEPETQLCLSGSQCFSLAHFASASTITAVLVLAAVTLAGGCGHNVMRRAA